MAKRKPLRPYKYGNTGYARGIDIQPYRAATLLHPVEVRPKRGLVKAHAKHQNDNLPFGPAPLSLADRFHGLPAELRTYIFSFLLVQPVKWSLTHKSSCPLFNNPQLDVRPDDWCYASRSHASVGSTPLRLWRIQTTGDRGWQGGRNDPWRSKYAPDVTNPFMDSNQWDNEWRETVTGLPFPRLSNDMPCLCARRTDLDVLLVCRQWYEEASQVLWGSNDFVFDSCDLFLDFVAACKAREKVTKISLINPGRHHPLKPSDPFEWPDWAYHKKRQALVAALRRFPRLTCLELDSCLLRDVRDVRALLRLGIRGLRRVQFVYHESAKESSATTTGLKSKPNMHWIDPMLGNRILLRGGLAEEAARAMKGEHRGWTKHKDIAATNAAKRKSTPFSKRQKPGVPLLQTAIDRHIAFEEWIKTLDIAPHRIVNCDDRGFWEKLWWKTGGRSRWSQSYLTVGRVAYEPSRYAGMVEREEEVVRVDREREWRDYFPFVEWEV